MRRVTLGLVALMALLLAACGASQTGGMGNMPGMSNSQLPTAAAPTMDPSMPGMNHGSMPTAAPAATTSGMAGMDHGSMATAAPAATAGGMAGMDHGNMPMGNSNAPYDAQFIDSMIIHHQGAIDMANQALKEGQRQEIKDLAANIIKAQEAEIAQMRAWRTQWYPNLADTGGTGMAMGDMAISSDTSKPFDQRFIEAMIPHHQGAIAMAKDAQQKAERQEIKTLAGNIIADQEKEIAQMQQWLKDWFGQ